MKNFIKNISARVLDVLFPRFCTVCNKALLAHETHLCTSCSLEIPRTHFHRIKFNPVEQLFAGKIMFEHASGFFFYEKGHPYANILHDLKYHNMPQLGRHFARIYAGELINDGMFTDIDCIIPVPLHKSKQAQRGYNQSEHIAKGFADVLGVPVYTDIIIAKRAHESQTNKGTLERWHNTQDIFTARNPERLQNKHILIVDDVVTTGATLLSAALTAEQIPGIKISLATLGVARLN